MWMFNDIGWSQGKANSEECFFELSEGQRLRKRFRQGHWTFLGLSDEGKWYGMHVSKPEGKWNSIVDAMQINFGESEHQVFRASSALDREYLRNKERCNIFRFTSAVTRQMQSDCVAQSSQAISLVFTEQSRIGVKN